MTRAYNDDLSDSVVDGVAVHVIGVDSEDDSANCMVVSVALDSADEMVSAATIDIKSFSSCGNAVGTGCAAFVVVLRAGANAASSITDGSNGYIPVFLNAERIVVSVNARSHACE